MARIKRGSAILETARQRLSGLKSITPKVNLGPALDVERYEQEINELSDSLDKYNEAITLLDRLQIELEEKELQVREKSRRMLAATGAQYGSGSSEYEGVGGTRPADYKHNTKKKPDNS